MAPNNHNRDLYDDQGYFVIEELLPNEECDEITDYARQVVTGTTPMPDHTGVWMESKAEELTLVSDTTRFDCLFKIGHQMHMADPVFQRYAMHDRVMDAVVDVLGPDVKCIQSMYLNKPRHVGIGQPFHQDSHYLKTSPDTLLGVWIALDDASADNGCLYVVPGSHDDPVHSHEKPIDPEQHIYIEVPAARVRRQFCVELRKGSVVFFGGRVLHRSGNNRSDRLRRSYVLHYASAKSSWLNDPKAVNPFLLVRGSEYEGCL